jgi:murein L,D-transpeptidase YcbB/YkuD
VPLLRKRLAATADRVRDLDSPEFDEPLADAVMSFQIVHGLEVDGLVGSDTTRALNVPVDERIAQITANLERWRWLPMQLASRYILVNIAGFRLEVVDDDRTVMTMRAVVGRPYRRTPVFAASMTYLVFSPYWNVPRSIATRDILPKVRRDPRYLEKQRIRVFRGWADDTPIDPATIDWEGISRPSFPYRLRQDPGPWNALGGVKFMFPNRFNVYLHDTPDRELFEESSRTFSSGCVRIERPADLAEYLLEDPEVWDHEAIRGSMDRRRELTVRVPRPIPVYLLYWTAWIDEAGAVHFRDDVYGQDRRLLVALGQPLPR